MEIFHGLRGSYAVQRILQLTWPEVINFWVFSSNVKTKVLVENMFLTISWKNKRTLFTEFNIRPTIHKYNNDVLYHGCPVKNVHLWTENYITWERMYVPLGRLKLNSHLGKFFGEHRNTAVRQFLRKPYSNDCEQTPLCVIISLYVSVI